MLTNKDYCDYETCVALKELGYKESCFGHYFNAEFYIDMPPKYYQSDKYVSVPTLYEAQKWLREQRLLFIEIDKILYGGYKFHVLDLTTYTEESCGDTDGYEEALAEGIKEAVKILKEK